MIHFLRGKLVDSLPTQAIVEVQGVGYEVLIPLSSFDRLPASGGEVFLLTVQVIREDHHALYGFVSAPERDLFKLLIQTVSGVGPKLALAMLSGMSVDGFRAAVAAGDLKALSAISGVGRKTAERVVVELRDKLGAFGTAGGPSPVPSARAGTPGELHFNDAVLALTALGHKPLEAQTLVRAAQALLGTGAGVEELVRASLRKGA